MASLHSKRLRNQYSLLRFDRRKKRCGHRDRPIGKLAGKCTISQLVLFSFYKNPYAYHVLEDALNRQTMAFAQFYWDKWRRKRLVVSDRLHKEIVDDLSKGNIQAAVRTLEKDISDYNGLDIPL